MDDLTPVQFVTRLSGVEVEAFAEASWQAEGWMDRRGAKIMAQNEGPIYEAMALATFLTGHHPQISSNGIYNGVENHNIRFGKSYVNGTRIIKTPLGNAPVWCLTTGLGSWVMRQGDQIMLTGNSVLFGAQASTLVRKYGFPNISLAKEVLDGFYSTYKRVSPWKEEVIALARSRYKKRKSPAYVTTILGRKRRLPALYYLDRKERSAAERQAISVTISGSAADYFKLAMIQVDQMLHEQEFESHILMQVHDELVVEVDEEYGETAMAVVKAGMEDITNPFTQEPILSLPVVADAKIVTRWSDAK
jgi:hypothetical protein